MLWKRPVEARPCETRGETNAETPRRGGVLRRKECVSFPDLPRFPALLGHRNEPSEAGATQQVGKGDALHAQGIGRFGRFPSTREETRMQETHGAPLSLCVSASLRSSRLRLKPWSDALGGAAPAMTHVSLWVVPRDHSTGTFSSTACASIWHCSAEHTLSL